MKALPTVLCNNILKRGDAENIDITPMKLQKLMYYVCRDYVKKTGVSPIDEGFLVWKYGPVLNSVYVEFKRFGANPIKGYAKDTSGNSYKVNEKANPVLSYVLDVVWAKYKRFSGPELSKKTHSPGSGWYRAYTNKRQIISLEDMAHDDSE